MFALLPKDMLTTIFGYCDPNTIKSMSLTDKKLRNFIKENQVLFMASCLDASPKALPLDHSWEKRWKAMSNFAVENCNQYRIDLKQFFDKDLFMLPHSLSFFNDEVLLVNKEASKIYRCNYLSDEIREFDLKFDSKIHQIYCFGHMLVISTENDLVFCDLKKNIEVKRYSNLSSGWIKFFDGNRCVYYNNSDAHYHLFNSITGEPVILQEYSKKYYYREEKAHLTDEIYYDGEYFVRKDSRQLSNYLSGLEVVDYQNKKFSHFSVEDECTRLGWQVIINSHLFAFATFCRGIEFSLNSYRDKTKKQFKTIATFKLDEHSYTTALQASEKYFIVGLTDHEQKRHSLGLWDYKDRVVLFNSTHVINYLVVNKGMILTSGYGKVFTLFDFTGKKIEKPKIDNKFQIVKSSNYLIKKIKDICDYLF